MAISQISLNSVATNPAYTNPYAKTEQQTSVPQVNQDAQKAPQVAKTDTVTISQQALQKVNEEMSGSRKPRRKSPMAAEKKTAVSVSQRRLSRLHRAIADGRKTSRFSGRLVFSAPQNAAQSCTTRSPPHHSPG